MNWYYADAGKQLGPISEADFQLLIRSGKIRPDTLVWREGMGNWQPYSAIQATASAPAESAPSPAAVAPTLSMTGAAPAPTSTPAPDVGTFGQAASWRYEDAGQPAGPVTEDELKSLAASGKVQPNTRVWRPGMDNWRTYGQVFSGAAGGAAAQPASHEIVCTECGKIFSKSNAIQYGSVWVCAECKPVFLQKVREGMAPGASTGGRYAGFWIRFAAKFLDGLILGLVFGVPVIVFFIFSLRSGGRTFGPQMVGLGLQILLQVFFWAIGVCYNGFMVGKYGATLGKMACGIKVVMADGSPLTMGRSFGRALADILSGLTCNIGYIIAGFDQQKRALHDHVCNTRVVFK